MSMNADPDLVDIGPLQAQVDEHEARVDNPHGVTKGQVGLGNVDNTSDADKPISTLTQAALDKRPSYIITAVVTLTTDGSGNLITRWVQIYSNATNTAADGGGSWRLPKDATVKNLSVVYNISASSVIAVTLVKDGVDSALTQTVTTSGGGRMEDVAHSVVSAKESRVEFKCSLVKNGTASARSCGFIVTAEIFI